jgi:polyisoprenoid-binding protein YceI
MDAVRRNVRRYLGRHFAPLLVIGALGACGAPATPAAPAAPGATATPVTAAPGAGDGARPTVTLTAPPAGALVFRLVPEQSRATFRVREQLAGVDLPSDAVGTTGAVAGMLVLRADGALVAPASRVSVDLRELKSDDPRRDSYIKQNTLRTAQFPFAEFVPTRAEGLPSPLPQSGERAFRLIGTMTVHGTQKEVVWETRARREGAQLTGQATATVRFGDFGMAPPRVPLVLSIMDEIRLELALVAAQDG